MLFFTCFWAVTYFLPLEFGVAENPKAKNKPSCLVDTLLKKHDFHTSLADISFNAKTKAFEVILQVFTDDFETVLAQANKVKELTLDKSKKHHPQIEAYIQNHFFVMDSKKQKFAFSFLGKEMEADITKLYIEIPVKKSLKGAKMQNTIFMEAFDDQVNMVNLAYKSAKKTYIFKRSSTAQLMELE